MSCLAHSEKPARGIPSQPYAAHVLNVVRSAVANAENAARHSQSYGRLLTAAVRVAAEFHDLGKLDGENQRVLASGSGRLLVNHVDAGVAHVLSGNLDRVRQVAAILIYAHHAGLPPLQEENAKGPGKAFRDDDLTVGELPVRTRTDNLLSQYERTHASEVDNLPAIDPPSVTTAINPVFLRIALSCLVDADHSDTARHYQDPVAFSPPPLQPSRRLELLNHYVEQLGRGKDDDRTRLRSSVYRQCRDADRSLRMLACDSPVGSGKTTAVMAHLLNVAATRGLRRVIVVLPFTNIIDQSVEVYRGALVEPEEDRDAVVAAHHHKAEFDDPSSRQFAYLWHAPVVVTTAVQFFETLAAARPAAIRKLHQVPGSAIFIDESHAALPAHLWPQAWKWLGELQQSWGCHVVFGSGSLERFWELKDFVDPPSTLPELVEHPVRRASATAEQRRVSYQSHSDSLDLNGLAAFIESTPGPRLLIVNTVQSAAAISRDLASRWGCEHVEHLSTALTPLHRKAALEFIKQRLQRPNHRDWTLVATSCVEAGVDISFRTGLRERCSLTSLLQTAGRVNRSNEHRDAVVWDIQLKHDHLLRPHPAFDASARILGELFAENRVAPEFCTESLRREITQAGTHKTKEEILRAERIVDFPLVEELFRVIASNTVMAVVDPNVIRRIEKREKVSCDELQAGSVQIWQYHAREWGIEEVNTAAGLWKWTLSYDSFLGYMAGVLPLIDGGESGFFV